MDEPATNLQRCVTRTEHLFAAWEQCSGNPDLHRQQAHKDASSEIDDMALKVPGIEWKVDRAKQECQQSLTKRSAAERDWETEVKTPGVFVQDVENLREEMQIAVNEYQLNYEEHAALMRTMAVAEARLESQKKIVIEIEEERKQLEWFGKTIVQCKRFA